MSKQRTKKTVKKRFKITGTGKIMRGRQYGRHRKSHKSKTLRRSYKKAVKLNKEQTKAIKKMI